MEDPRAHQRPAEQGRTPLVQSHQPPEDETHQEPKSTFVLMLLFLMLLAGIWYYVYQILLSRQ
ncbi:MAG: hypothetical protein ACKOWF_12780 [Chloroflexota bacterium]